MKWKQYALDTEKIVNEYLIEIRRLEEEVKKLKQLKEMECCGAPHLCPIC